MYATERKRSYALQVPRQSIPEEEVADRSKSLKDRVIYKASAMFFPLKFLDKGSIRFSLKRRTCPKLN